MDRGYIKLWRKIEDSGLLTSHHTLALWIYILISVTYKERNVIIDHKTITLQPGQMIAGRKSLAKTLRVHESVIRRSLSRLKTDHQITVKPTNKYSIITVLNWDSYQSAECDDRPTEKSYTDQQKTNKRPTKDQQKTTNKKERSKEGKNSLYTESSGISNNSMAPDTPQQPLCSSSDPSTLGFETGVIITPDHGKCRYTPRYQECVEQAREVITHLNSVAHKNEPMSGFGFLKAVTLIWNNIPPSELIRVIDTKWQDPKFDRRWMVSDTLFKPENFSRYQKETPEDYQEQKPKTGMLAPINVPGKYDENENDFDIVTVPGGYKRRNEKGEWEFIALENDDG